MTKQEAERNIGKWREITRHFIDKKVKLNVRREELLQEMKQLQEDYIKALPVKIGDKIMDEDGRVGWLSRIVPYLFTIGKVYEGNIEIDPFLLYGEKRWYS